MPCECDNQSKLNYARYYDSPDGCDIPTKMMVTSRYGITAGLVLGTYDVMMYSHALGLGRILKRYATHVVPLGLMGATFAAVANGALHLRNRDDVYNYFFGGFACGPILAAYLGSGHAVLLGGLALGAIGMIKKNAVENNYTLLTVPPSHMGMINGWRHDYTLAEDPLDEEILKCGIHKK